MASITRTYERSKSTIDLSTLKELMKEHMGDGPQDAWLEAGDVLTLSLYLHFFVSLGQVTTRVNKLAIAGCADDLWKLGKHKANLFGTALEKAFSYAKRAGDMAINGSKLPGEVRQVYHAMTGKLPGEASAVKVEPSAVKVELEEPSAGKAEASAIKMPMEAIKEELTPEN